LCYSYQSVGATFYWKHEQVVTASSQNERGGHLELVQATGAPATVLVRRRVGAATFTARAAGARAAIVGRATVVGGATIVGGAATVTTRAGRTAIVRVRVTTVTAGAGAAVVGVGVAAVIAGAGGTAIVGVVAATAGAAVARRTTIAGGTSVARRATVTAAASTADPVGRLALSELFSKKIEEMRQSCTNLAEAFRKTSLDNGLSGSGSLRAGGCFSFEAGHVLGDRGSVSLELRLGVVDDLG
jgi:hypothetical protein